MKAQALISLTYFENGYKNYHYFVVHTNEIEIQFYIIRELLKTVTTTRVPLPHRYAPDYM
jgi:hypothetical protein